jgi:hypothetical protein
MFKKGLSSVKNLIAILVLILITAIGNSLFAQENDVSIPQVEIAGTQLLKINSSIVNQEYNLYINLPRFFNDTSRTFPVIYLLDAQWDFPLLNAIYGEQYYDGFLPDAITIGITWGGENPNYDDLRRRDFTPTKIGQTLYSGGAEKFLAFIKEELIPFIDTEFRTNGDRVLIGSSFGGLFTLYAMFNETELFNRYVLTSPATGWDNQVISSYEKKYSEGSKIPVKLYMAIGGYEDVNAFQKFADNLKEKNYKGLELKTFVLDGIGHSGSKAEGYTRGLQFVFEKKPLMLNDEILEQYLGTYQINIELIIKISKEGKNLIAEIPGNQKMILYALNEKDFYVKGQYLFLHFNENESGKITGFQLRHFNGQEIFKKTE